MARTNILCGFGTSFEAKRWLSLDPCGVFGITLSWGVHVYALAVIPLFVLGGSLLSTLVYCICYIPSALLALASLFMASTTDPGAVPLGARPLVRVRRATSASLHGESSSPDEEPNRAIRRCHKCQDNYKPARAHHDSVTGRCIVKFDHFCPWVNNAVGALNHKFFCLFLFYTAITCLLSLLLLLMRVINCGFVQKEQKIQEDASIHSKGTDPHQPPNRFLVDASSSSTGTGSGAYMDPQCAVFYKSNLVLALFLISLIFLIFTVSMGCEQLEAIETGKGKIARMKMRVGASGTEFARVSEEFNEMFGGDSPHPTWHWFLPLTVKFPRGMKKIVLGYDWDETSMTPYQEEESKNVTTGDQELEELERGQRTVVKDNSVSLIGASPPPLPSRSAGLDRNNSNGSSVSLESGAGVKNRRPRSLDDPKEIV